MVEIPAGIRRTIEQYIAELGKHKIPVERAVLFGSYAAGTYREYSDINLAIVSDFFEGFRFEDRRKIRRLTQFVSEDLEMLPYRPEDFTPDDPFVKEILETGIDVTHGFEAVSKN